MMASLPEASTAAATLARTCRRSRNWTAAADWIAGWLNTRGSAVDPSNEGGLPSVEAWLFALDGDYVERDLIKFPDGTRVCWHLGRTARNTRVGLSNGSGSRAGTRGRLQPLLVAAPNGLHVDARVHGFAHLLNGAIGIIVAAHTPGYLS